MPDLEPAHPTKKPSRLLADRPMTHDALWYDCETEGRDEGRGLTVVVGGTVLTLAALGIAAWYLA